MPAHIDGVSRHHARIHLQSGGAFIEDLGSANGTFLNGWPVQGRMPLKPGDQVRLGAHHQLDLRSVWSTPAPYPAPMPVVPQRPVLVGAPPAMVPAPAAPAPQVQLMASPAAPMAPRVEVVHSIASPAASGPPSCPVCSSTHIQMNGAQNQGGGGSGGCLVMLVLVILFVLAPALFFIPVLVAAIAVVLKPEIMVMAAAVLALVVVFAIVAAASRKSHRCTTCGHQFNLVL